MHPQPDSIIGQIVAMCFIVYIFTAVVSGFRWPEKYTKKKKKKSEWLYKLGEVYEEEDQYHPPSHVDILIETPKPKKSKKSKKSKKRKKKSTKPAKPKPHPLFEDGVSAMVALGHKRAASKQAVIDAINESNPSTLEELIKAVYGKKK